MDSPASLTDATLDNIREHEGVFFSPKPNEPYFISRLNRTRLLNRTTKLIEEHAMIAPLDISRGTDDEAITHKGSSHIDDDNSLLASSNQQPSCEVDTPLDSDMDLNNLDRTAMSDTLLEQPIVDPKLIETLGISQGSLAVVEQRPVIPDNKSNQPIPVVVNHTTSPNSHSPQQVHSLTANTPRSPKSPRANAGVRTPPTRVVNLPGLRSHSPTSSEQPNTPVDDTFNNTSLPTPMLQHCGESPGTPKPSCQVEFDCSLQTTPVPLNNSTKLVIAEQPASSVPILHTPQMPDPKVTATPRSILSTSGRNDTVRRSVKRVIIVSPVKEDMEEIQPFKKLKTGTEDALPISRLPVPTLQKLTITGSRVTTPSLEKRKPTTGSSATGGRLSLSMAADAALQNLHMELAAEASLPAIGRSQEMGDPVDSGASRISTPQHHGMEMLNGVAKPPKETPLRRLLFASSTAGKLSGAQKRSVPTPLATIPNVQSSSDDSSGFRFVFSTNSESTTTNGQRSASPTPTLSPPPLAGGFTFTTEPFRSPVRAMNKQVRTLTQTSPAKGRLVSQLPPGRSPARLATQTLPALSQSTALTSSPSRTQSRPTKSSPFKESSNRLLTDSSQTMQPPKHAIPTLKSSLNATAKVVSGPSRLPRLGLQQVKAIPPPTRVFMAHIPSVTLGGSPSKMATHTAENEPPASSTGLRKKKMRQVIPGTMTNWEGKPKDLTSTTSYESNPVEGTLKDSSLPNKDEGPLKEIAIADAPQPGSSNEGTPDSTTVPSNVASLGSIFIESNQSPPGGVRRSRRLSSEAAECVGEGNEPSPPTRSRSARLRQVASSSQPPSQPEKTKAKSTASTTSNAPDPKAIAMLTSKNTKRNERYFNDLDLQVVKMDCPRPPSPTTKVRTILEKQQSGDTATKTRTTRASRKEALKDEVDEDASGEVLPMVHNPRKHTRGAGEDEDYHTPKRRRIEDMIAHGTPPIPHLNISNAEKGSGSASSGSSKAGSAEPSGSKGKSVRWDKRLIFDAEKGESVKVPTNGNRSCLAKTSNQNLDAHGNVLHADKPPEDVTKDKVVVIKYVYVDDEPEAPPPPPSPRRVSKRKR